MNISTFRGLSTIISGLFLGLFQTEALSVSDRVYEIQMKRLLNPSQVVRKAEQLRQSVFIYDGLKDTDIDYIMQEQFERVENMMFIRTIVVNDDGDEEELEDGCD